MAAELIAKLTLDTYRENKIPPLVIPQRDYKARVVEVRLTTQGRPVLADAAAAASITAKRLSDGSEKTFAGEMNENGTCTVPITQWMLESEGTVHCTVSVTGADYQYSANKFDLYVKYRPDATEVSPDDPQKDLITEVIAGEAGRVAAEEKRVSAEIERETAESERNDSEEERNAAETARQAAESARAEAFAASEAGRSESFAAAEENRQKTFQQAETARQAAEQTRKDAEAARVAAETVRAEEFATWGDIIAGVEQYDSRISRNDKRITNLEQGLMADAFETDASVAYVKDVPADALPYAAVAKVGGMTYKDGDTLKSAKVTEIESVGVNLVPNTPYAKNTLPIPEAVQALDGYGDGASELVYNYIDWEKKQFVKRVSKVDMGTLAWTYSTIFTAVVSGRKVGNNNFICSKYPNSKALSTSLMENGTILGNSLVESVYVKDTTYTDAASFKAAMSGVMLYYELATPIITDISDILPADNLLGVEGGGTVTAVNEHGLAAPTEIIYQLKGVAE